MKQKYLILKNDEKNELTIQEFAELEKSNVYTLLCEETYNGDAIASTISRGNEALISALRTINLYPPGLYAEKVAEAIITLYNSESDQSIEFFIDDKDFFQKIGENPKMWMQSKMNRANLMKRLNKSQRILMDCMKIMTQ